MEYSLEPLTINNEQYLSVKQFALLTSHSEASINQLINRGNKFRKLLSKRFPTISNKPLILACEFTEFIFTQTGRKMGTGQQTGFKYKQDGSSYQVFLNQEGKELIQTNIIPKNMEKELTKVYIKRDKEWNPILKEGNGINGEKASKELKDTIKNINKEPTLDDILKQTEDILNK